MTFDVQVAEQGPSFVITPPPGITVVISDPDSEGTTTIATPEVTIERVAAPLVEVTIAPSGPQGAQGPTGASGSPPYVFIQSSPSAQWHIVHGLGSNPSVVVVRDDGVTIGGFGAGYPDLLTTDLYFGVPTRGVATLNP